MVWNIHCKSNAVAARYHGIDDVADALRHQAVPTLTRMHGSISCGGCKAGNTAREPTPDAPAVREARPAHGCRTARRVGQDGKPHPSCRQASTARRAGRLPIAIPGVADPSPVLLVRRLWQPVSRPPVPDFVTTSTLPTRNPARCDLVHRGFRRSVVSLRHGPENLPNIVRVRRQDRHRPDRGRRGLGPLCVHLPDAGLSNA